MRLGYTKKASAVSVLIALFLAGCGQQVRQYQALQQRESASLQTYVGGPVFRVDKTRDLPNAFGQADIFGGKVNEGYLELRYLGLTAEGHAVFRVIDQRIQSNETTVTRRGWATTLSTRSASGTYSGTSTALGNNMVTTAGQWSGSAYGTSFTMLPPQAQVIVHAPNVADFLFDQGVQDSFIIESIRVSVLQAAATSLQYRIDDLAN